MSYSTNQSPFWRYFRDTLALPFLAVAGPLSALVHGLARYMDTVRQDILWLRNQFVPPKAEDIFLPTYGEARGVPRTRFDSDSQYRIRVERAFVWHKQGAKVQGLPAILAEYGFDSGTIVNLRDSNPALWAHFDVTLLKPPPDFSARDAAAVLALANQYKPGRSIIRTVQFASQQRAGLHLGVAAQTVVTVDHTVRPRTSEPPQPGTLRFAAALHSVVRIEHRIQGASA